MALDDSSSENPPENPETIDTQAVIQAFCNNEAEAVYLGKHGGILWKLLRKSQNPSTGEWTGHTWTDIRRKHIYREAILGITEEHGQSDIVDACLLEDLEGVRTKSTRGVVSFPKMGLISGTEFALSSGLEVARLVGNPNGRIRKKIDEIPLGEIVSGFWHHLSRNTTWEMTTKTGLNIAILTSERQGIEPLNVIDWARRSFIVETFPLLPALVNGLEYLLMIPDDLLEYSVMYLEGKSTHSHIRLRDHEHVFNGLYSIVMLGLRNGNSELTAKLERCPKFKAMVDAGTEERKKQVEATKIREEQLAAEREKTTNSQMDNFEKCMEDFHPSEEVFVHDILTAVRTHYSDISCKSLTDDSRGTASISDFDYWQMSFEDKSLSVDAKARWTAISTKWEVVRSLWLGQISGFAANPTRETYERIIDKQFSGSCEGYELGHLNNTAARLAEAKVFPENCVVFQLLSEKRCELERLIKKSQEERRVAELEQEHLKAERERQEAAHEAASEYQKALSAYQEIIQSVEREKQEAIEEQGFYPEELEKEHIAKLIEGKSGYIKELYRIGTGMNIDACTYVETENEETLAYVELAGDHSGSGEESGGSGSGGYHLGMQLVLTMQLRMSLNSSDRIFTETGSDLERRRTRLEMVDWTTPHEVGHIIDVLHREGEEDDKSKHSNNVITRHLDELADIIKDLPVDQRAFYQTEIRELMEECMIDGIGYRLIQNYGTSDFEYDQQEHRLEQAAHAFIAACTIARYNMGTYLDVEMDKKCGIRFCLILQRFIANAKIQLENIWKLPDNTLEDISLNLQDEIIELERLYYKIQIKIVAESDNRLIDLGIEEKIETLFQTMFIEGLDLELHPPA